MIATIHCGTVGDSMQPKRPTMREYIDRVIVVFFLVSTLADLSYRMPCCIGTCDDRSDSQDTSVVTDTAHNVLTITSVASDESQPERHSKSDVATEGCFCCAPALPGSVPVVAQLLGNALATDLKNNSTPSPPSKSPFHPPRIS